MAIPYSHRNRLPNDSPALDVLSLGLPEWDDRLAVWRVALVSRADLTCPVGEIQIAPSGVINRAPSPAMVGTRLGELGKSSGPRTRSGSARIAFPPIPNKVILGDSPGPFQSN